MIDPVVSVGMITYNQFHYIVQSIEGVMQQKANFPFELVIGEDCSTDGTREIVLKYEQNYPDIIRVITSDNNVGAVMNSCRTMKSCKGKYIAFCEGDDYWHHPYKLQKQVDFLESHMECGLILADADVYYCKSKKYIKSYNSHNGYQSPMNLTIDQIMGGGKMMKWTCTAVIRKKILEQIVESDPYLYKSGTFLMIDNQLWAETSLTSKVAYIPESLATYRVRDESASRSNNRIKHWRFWQSASEMKLYLCDKHKLADRIRRSEESGWYESSLRLAFYDRNAKLADEVRKRKGTLTWQEWFRYFGAKNLVIFNIYRVASLILSLFRNENNGRL